MPTEWTLEQRLLALMRLPWTVRCEKNEEDGYLVARVAEMPDAIAIGANDKELGRELWDSLKESLLVRLTHGDLVPLPQGTQLPWESGTEMPRRRVLAVLRDSRLNAWEVRDVTSLSPIIEV